MSHFRSSRSSVESSAADPADEVNLGGVKEREDLERCLHCGDVVSAAVFGERRVRRIVWSMSFRRLSMCTPEWTACVLRSSRSSYLRNSAVQAEVELVQYKQKLN